jgi:predicted trehalose synthase
VAPPVDRLLDLSTAYIERQAWFAPVGGGSGPIRLLECAVLRDEHPGLARIILDKEGRAYQLLLGWRLSTDAADALGGRDAALLGAAEDNGQRVVVYDALVDDDLAREILTIVTGGNEHAARVRRVSSLVSHASLVYDERLFMKCYRVLEDGQRPEVEAVLGLDRIGYNALLAPIGHWSALGYDLALVREFLPSALEGRLLALTSLRDLLAHASDGTDAPGSRVLLAIGEAATALDLEQASAAAGGDLASEMRRLGETTAGLHRGFESAFGTHALDPATLAAYIGDSERQVPVAVSGARLSHRDVAARIAGVGPAALGRAIRIHGDYHLRRVMRADTGWLVSGFADDPLYATETPDPSLPARVGSPVEDLADMWFAIERVAAEALGQRSHDDAALAVALARAWTRRNQLAFLGGYLDASGDAGLVPDDPEVVALLLAGFVAVRAERYEATSAPE